MGDMPTSKCSMFVFRPRLLNVARLFTWLWRNDNFSHIYLFLAVNCFAALPDVSLSFFILAYVSRSVFHLDRMRFSVLVKGIVKEGY